MFLTRLNVLNFKNYEQAEFYPSPSVNAIVGNNGAGKTNLLDAIHYLSLCKSYFNPVDTQNIQQGKDFFMVQGIFNHNDVEENIYCGFKKGQKKIFKRNQNEYDRLADHIGLIPVVMISPTDSVLITGGSEERRKFMDSIISQYNHQYLENLINYVRVLSQRNSYLKNAHKNSDHEVLSVWDEQLIFLGEKIFEVRKKFIEQLVPIFNRYYNFIAGSKENSSVVYQSQLSQHDFRSALNASREKDFYLQYTSTGIHKDDLILFIGEFPVKRFASQGQQKSFLLSLKLAQFEFMQKIKKAEPILLLDDVFDKLDDYRVNKLMELVSTSGFGQIFITDAHPQRIREIFSSLNVPLTIFSVQDGIMQQYAIEF